MSLAKFLYTEVVWIRRVGLGGRHVVFQINEQKFNFVTNFQTEFRRLCIEKYVWTNQLV